MKLRTGFVSNSSSASFVLQTRRSQEELLSMIYGQFDFSWMGKKQILTGIYKNIKSWKEYENEKDKKDSLTKLWVDNAREAIKDLENQKENINKLEEGTQEYVKWVLMYYGILISENSLGTTLLSSTIMYNNSDDLGEVLKSIMCMLSVMNDPFTVHVNND